MRRRSKKASAAVTPEIEGGAPRQIGPTPADMEREVQARIAEHQSLQARQEVEALMSLKIPRVSTKKTEVLVKHISSEAKKDPTAMAQVVRSWLDGENQR